VRLLSLDLDGIERLIKDYDTSTKALKEELIRVCWFMRGGLSYSESHLLTPDERVLINKVVESNLEITKETQLPFF
jgi:hypothetical protein